ncbi:MAG: ECF transporter S component [Oscillospiraceae bacterium]|nr:ECF transporter S component [Oscillospiraceae bacterium]
MNSKTKKMVGIGLFTAIVVVLQLLGGGIRFGMFSISLVLIPIVVGAAVYGWYAGAWLGFAFGVTVLLSGDAGAFLAVDPLATVLVVLVKGTLCGLCSGLVYKAFQRSNKILAVILAAIVCPVVNTGVFLLGCYIFFLPTIIEWAALYGYADVGTYMIVGLAGINFLIELAVNIVLAPVITRLIRFAKK